MNGSDERVPLLDLSGIDAGEKRSPAANDVPTATAGAVEDEPRAPVPSTPFLAPPLPSGRRPAPIPQAPLLPSQLPWPEPMPLRAEGQREPYPVEALPDIVRAAVEDVQQFVQAPMAMVATSAVVAMAISAQARVDIARDSQLVGPVGLNALTLAESGERKSTVDRYFNRALDRYEKDQRKKMARPLRRYAAEMEAWEAVRQGIKANIRASSKDGESTEAEEQRLVQHDERKPHRPRVPQLRVDDATPEGLGDKLVNEWPVAAMLSDEGGTILGGYGMGRESVVRNISALNKLWDGKSVSAKRKVAESLASISVRACLHIQVQPSVILDFYRRVGDLARGAGLFARFLMCCPESTQGARLYVDPPTGSDALDVFDAAMYAALDVEIDLEEDGGCEPPVMVLDPKAKSAWCEFHDEIELQLGAGGALGDVRESANKIADNAARLAAVFQFHERRLPSDPVSPDNLERATRIVRWHLEEARRFFGELTVPEERVRAVQLDEWITVRLHEDGDNRIRANEILQAGPGALRKASVRDEALTLLAELGRVRVDDTAGTRYVLRNPKLLSEA